MWSNVWKLHRYIVFMTSDPDNDGVIKERYLSINMCIEQCTQVCWLFENAE